MDKRIGKEFLKPSVGFGEVVFKKTFLIWFIYLKN